MHIRPQISTVKNFEMISSFFFYCYSFCLLTLNFRIEKQPKNVLFFFFAFTPLGQYVITRNTYKNQRTNKTEYKIPTISMLPDSSCRLFV